MKQYASFYCRFSFGLLLVFLLLFGFFLSLASGGYPAFDFEFLFYKKSRKDFYDNMYKNKNVFSKNKNILIVDSSTFFPVSGGHCLLRFFFSFLIFFVLFFFIHKFLSSYSFLDFIIGFSSLGFFRLILIVVYWFFIFLFVNFLVCFPCLFFSKKRNLIDFLFGTCVIED